MGHERVEVCAFTFNDRFHPSIGAISHPAGQSQGSGMGTGVVSEVNSLNDTAEKNVCPRFHSLVRCIGMVIQFNVYSRCSNKSKVSANRCQYSKNLTLKWGYVRLYRAKLSPYRWFGKNVHYQGKGR